MSVSLWLLIFTLTAETKIYGYRNQKLKKFVCRRLRKHILNILATERFGFRKELPTENAAYRLRNMGECVLCL